MAGIISMFFCLFWDAFCCLYLVTGMCDFLDINGISRVTMQDPQSVARSVNSLEISKCQHLNSTISFSFIRWTTTNRNFCSPWEKLGDCQLFPVPPLAHCFCLRIGDGRRFLSVPWTEKTLPCVVPRLLGSCFS